MITDQNQYDSTNAPYHYWVPAQTYRDYYTVETDYGNYHRFHNPDPNVIVKSMYGADYIADGVSRYITVWNINYLDDLLAKNPATVNMIAAQYSNKTDAWWKLFVNEFNAANPNINLVVDVVSWNDIHTLVDSRIANGEAPDLLNIDTFDDYQADGLLLPAKDWVSDETYAKFFPSFLAESVVDDVVWAVPDLASARALYYNKDILEAAAVADPSGWGEMYAAGITVPTTWGGLYGACLAIKASNPDIYPWGVDMTTDEGQACFAYYAWNNGGGFTDADGNWALNSAENVVAVDFSNMMVAEGLTNPSPTTETRWDLQEMFAAGKLAMMIGPNQISEYCEGRGINYGIASLPTNGDNAVTSIGVMDRIMCFDNHYTKAELYAITKVIDAFYDDESYTEWVMMEGFLPATSTGCKVMAERDPVNAAWYDILSSAKFYPLEKAEWAEVRQGVIAVLQETLQGGDPEALLDALQARVAG